MLAGMIVFLLLSAVESPATPIRPDVQKLIKQSEQANRPFIPARVGWSDPATVTVKNPVLESLQGDKLHQQMREELATIATPDPWIALALAMVIFLMRKLRAMEAERNRAMATARLAEVPAPQARQAALRT